MEFDEISANPFFNDELKMFDENFFVNDCSPKKRPASPESKRKAFAKLESGSIEFSSKLEKMIEKTPSVVRNSEKIENVVSSTEINVSKAIETTS